MNINLANFETIVDPVIYERGLQCKSGGAIISVEAIDDNHFNAVVSGSEDYVVNIALSKKEELFTFDCSCPFNASPVCKHLVAVLLLLKEKKNKNTPIPKADLFLINNTLKDRSKKELEQLLLNLAKSDILIKGRILKELGLKSKDS